MRNETMTWAEVSARLAAARNYWGWAPHRHRVPSAAPVWGVVAGDTLCLYSERSTVKARDLAADPRVVVHLESGEDVVIVPGVTEGLGTPLEVSVRGRGARGEIRQAGGPAVPAGR
jgi:hypothetical protein